MEGPDLSHEAVCYTQLDNPMLSEARNSRFDEGRQEIQESGTRLEPSRYYGP
jgi:hypothetical protein